MTVATTMTESDAALLAAHLEDEAAAQKDLEEALRGLEGRVVANDTEGLEETLRSLQPLIGRLEGVAERRRRTFAHLSRILRAAGGLGEAVAGLPERIRGEVREALAKARAAARSARAVNVRVRHLVRSMASLDRAILRALFGIEQTSVTYDRGARTREDSDGPLLDRSL